jgi:hypothetical protein
MWGLVAAHELADDYEPPPPRKWWVIAFAILLYLYAAAVAWTIYDPSHTTSATPPAPTGPAPP